MAKKPKTRNALIVAVAFGFIVPAVTWAITSREQRLPRGTAPDAGSTVTPVRHAASSRGLKRPDNLQEPSAILAAIVARYGGEAILEASFGGPTPGWTGTEDPNAPLPARLRNGRWLYTTVAGGESGPSSIGPIWEANLVAGALRDELHLAGVKGELIASNISVRLPNGKVMRNVGGGIGDVVFGQRFADASSSAIEDSLRESAAGLGLDVVSIKVFRPLQPAPAVIVSTKKPLQFMQNIDSIAARLFGGPAAYEGEYLEARDASGRPVLIQASDFRTGVGMRWMPPELNPRLRARN